MSGKNRWWLVALGCLVLAAAGDCDGGFWGLHRPSPACVADAFRCRPLDMVPAPDLARIACPSGACPNGDSPLCDNGFCRPCDPVFDNALCAAQQPATPYCGDGGRCVGCRADTDCAAAAPICEPDRKVCASCDAGAKCPAGSICWGGGCHGAGEVAWVDNRGRDIATCRADGRTHDGAQATPYCAIQDALAAVPSRDYIVVAASPQPYAEALAIGRSVNLIGPGRKAAVQATVSGGVTVTAAKVKLVIDGLAITGSTGGGVVCEGKAEAKITVRDSFVKDNKLAGIKVDGCDLEVDASVIRRNEGGGISVAAGRYLIENCFVGNNGSNGMQVDPGVAIKMSSTGTFRFNTVTGNLALLAAGGVQCASPALLDASIITGNNQFQGSQLSGACTLSHVVMRLNEEKPAPQGATLENVRFVNEAQGDFHLDPSTTGCFDAIPVDGGMPYPDVTHDIDLSPRPKGSGFDIGAHELR